jgi:hypothetical protein
MNEQRDSSPSFPHQTGFIKILHSLIIVSLLMMIGSGLTIYNANPVFGKNRVMNGLAVFNESSSKIKHSSYRKSCLGDDIRHRNRSIQIFFLCNLPSRVIQTVCGVGYALRE